MIENLSLINIPFTCEISNKNFKIINKANSIIGEFFILSEVITSKNNFKNHIHLEVNKVNLDDIVHLHKELQKVKTHPRITRITNLYSQVT